MSKQPTSDKQQQDEGDYTEEQIKEMMKDPKYWRDQDQEYIKIIEDGFRKLYPIDDNRTGTIGGETYTFTEEELAIVKSKVFDEWRNKFNSDERPPLDKISSILRVLSFVVDDVVTKLMEDK